MTKEDKQQLGQEAESVLDFKDAKEMTIGQANRNNPLPILVPCHRVIGKNGKLVGYSGSSEEGLKIKEQLLVIENPTLQEITLF